MLSLAILIAALPALPSAEDPDLPGRAQVQDALNDLEKCRGLTGPECSPPLRVYRVFEARCTKIPPEDGRPAAACRVDETLTYADPEHEVTRHRDECVRLAKHGTAQWAVLQIRDRPCEMPSMVTHDPNPQPDHAQLEKALASLYRCYDFDGITDCFVQPERGRLEASRCAPIPPGDEGHVRVACRITGSVTFRPHAPERHLTDYCMRLDRLTPADRSPALWVRIYVPDTVRCEIR